MLIKSNFAKMESFSLIPVSTECPYIEVMFNPHAKILAIIGKTKKEQFHSVPRLDGNGDPEKRKGASDPNNPYKTQRITQETYTEYYLRDREDIENFIKMFAVNSKEFDYESFMNMETMDAPDTSGIAKGSPIILEK